jgi:hypothetical protein
MNDHDDFDARIRAACRSEPAIADNGFSARVLDALPTAPPARAPGALPLLGGLVALPCLVLLIARSGWVPVAWPETLFSALLMTGLGALVWLGTAPAPRLDHDDRRPH